MLASKRYDTKAAQLVGAAQDVSLMPSEECLGPLVHLALTPEF